MLKIFGHLLNHHGNIGWLFHIDIATVAFVNLFIALQLLFIGRLMLLVIFIHILALSIGSDLIFIGVTLMMLPLLLLWCLLLSLTLPLLHLLRIVELSGLVWLCRHIA